MKSIRITFFVTAAILSSMLLSTLKVQAQTSYEQCASGSKKLYQDILVYNETEKISPQHAVVGTRLSEELKKLKLDDVTLQQKVHLLESSFARCYVELTADEEQSIQMDIEMFKKGNHPSASED